MHFNQGVSAGYGAYPLLRCQSVCFSVPIFRFILITLPPVVKFKDPQTGISCDININDQLGLFNTRLITRYCELAPVLRPLLVALKQWAKPLGLNNPSGTGVTTSFSSYALTLMSIAFLQVRYAMFTYKYVGYMINSYPFTSPASSCQICRGT